MTTKPKDNPNVHGTRAKTALVTVRHPASDVHLLAAIGEKKGHQDRSETVREAVREYIRANNHLLLGEAA